MLYCHDCGEAITGTYGLPDNGYGGPTKCRHGCEERRPAMAKAISDKQHRAAAIKRLIRPSDDTFACWGMNADSAAVAAWGARAIWHASSGRTLDLLRDRQAFHFDRFGGADHPMNECTEALPMGWAVQDLCDWNNKIGLPVARYILKDKKLTDGHWLPRDEMAGSDQIWIRNQRYCMTLSPFGCGYMGVASWAYESSAHYGPEKLSEGINHHPDMVRFEVVCHDGPDRPDKGIRQAYRWGLIDVEPTGGPKLAMISRTGDELELEAELEDFLEE